MSHVEERKEKNCLNCGSTVLGRYCQVCGQENIVPHETFGHMVKHFFYDITHFDSKFADSLKYLVSNPGFLSKEYMRGRRVNYLNPIKMYVFTSAVFFLIFFSLFSVSEESFSLNNKKALSEEEFDKIKEGAYKKADDKEDSAAIKKAIDFVEGGDTLKKKKKGVNRISFGFDEETDRYNSVAEYDSAQHLLAEDKRDGWFERLMIRKAISMNVKYGKNDNRLAAEVINSFMHSFPYMLFVSLPLYALFLKLLYYRNKKLFFVDHGIFLVHLYIFTFIFILVFIGLGKLGDALGWDWIAWIQGILVLYGIWHAFKSMRNFYEQGFWKTFLKFTLFNIICFVSILILTSIFLIFTFFKV